MPDPSPPLSSPDGVPASPPMGPPGRPPARPPARRPSLDNDLGFGSVVARESRRRLLNRDGTFNVRREGLGPVERFAPYHSLLVMPWPEFLAYVAVLYVAVNVGFALAFLLCGTGTITDPGNTVPDNPFARAFFFSVETFATIGYGSLAPSGLAANLLMTAESLVGILAAALITGIVFARFSRPTARVRFSRHAVLAPYGAGPGGTAFMFRLINERRTELLQLEMRVLFSRLVDDGGRRVRRFDPLALEREHVEFFPLSWTVVHPIDEASPLRGVDAAALERDDAEFLILLSAVDETNAQTVHARTSYKPADLVAGARFTSMFNPPFADGTLSVDVSRLDAIERV